MSLINLSLDAKMVDWAFEAILYFFISILSLLVGLMWIVSTVKKWSIVWYTTIFVVYSIKKVEGYIYSM